MKEITAKEFEKEVLQGGKVALDFYSTECPPCEALAPKFDNMNEIYGKDITLLKIFRQGNKELATQLDVNSSPTVLFFDNGKQVGEKLSGGIKKSDLARNLDALLPKDKVAVIKSKIKKNNQ
ncbi:MAG: thioredoxin family protein [Bacteroidales bacterium]|nr:thioredoxin family protein [Bacteroidales bacterium]